MNKRKYWTAALAGLALLSSGQGFADPTSESYQATLGVIEQCEQLEHGQPNQALELIQPLVDRIDAQAQPFLRIRALGCRAWSLSVLGRMDEIVEDILEIERLSISLEQPQQQSRSLRLLASLKQRSGDTVESIDTLKRALEIAQENNLQGDLVPLYTNLGILHSEAKNHELAIEHYELALTILDQSGEDPSSRLPILYNLGLTYAGIGQLEKAVSTLEQLLEPLEAPGMEIRLASLLTVLGSIRQEQGALDEAEALLKRSAALHENLNNPAERTALLIDLGRLALEKNQIQAALDYSEQALSTARESNYSMSIRGALRSRAAALQASGRTDEAIELLYEYIELSEIHSQDQQESDLNELQAQVGFKRQALELAELRTQQQQQAHVLNQQQLRLRAGLIIGSMILIGALFAFVWQRRTNRHLSQLSRTDQLTGLPNRRRIMNFLSEAINSGNADSYVLMLLDLDYFKLINDEHGHDAGDRALFEVAEQLRAFAQEHGFDVGRWGGEEFLMLFQAENARDAVRLTTELLDRVAAIRPGSRSQSQIRLTASAGFAPLCSLHQSPDQRIWEPALLIADQLLYRAKKAGRNGFFGVWPTTDHVKIEPHHLDVAIESGIYQLLQKTG